MGDDDVSINQETTGLLMVHADFFSSTRFRTYDADTVQKIVVLLCGGNDAATVAGDIMTQMVLDGGAGNDLLIAGGGPTVLLGGAGEDVLIGGGGAICSSVARAETGSWGVAAMTS